MGFENQHPNTYSGDPHCSLPYPLSESGQAKNKKFKLEGGGRPARLRQEVQKFKAILDYLVRPQDTVPKQSKTRRRSNQSYLPSLGLRNDFFLKQQ